MESIGKIIGQAVLLFLGALLALLVGGLATPVLWLLLRLLGLIEWLAWVAGSYQRLMIGGGLLLGAMVGGILLHLIQQGYGESHKLGVPAGMIGGAMGGLASSLMFFTIVAVL
ncbi:MAG: hypothetical protein R3C14_05875 [Caldilineaceae bacterium]